MEFAKVSVLVQKVAQDEFCILTFLSLRSDRMLGYTSLSEADVRPLKDLSNLIVHCYDSILETFNAVFNHA